MSSAPQTGLIKGLSYSMPTSGTIRLGFVRHIVKNGKTIRVPAKDDEFTLTTKIKDDAGEWMRHALDGQLRESHGIDVKGPEGEAVRKLRSIPVTIVFDRPDLNMTEQFAAFTHTGSPVCVGDGTTARRRQDDGSVSEESCPGAQHCSFGKANRCDAFLRLLVRVEGQPETAPPFILRTGSINAVADNRATLEHWRSMYGGRLAGLPFDFLLDAKQSAMSMQSIFYYGRLEPRFASVVEGAQILKQARAEDADLGIDRAAAEDALVQLRANGAFAEAAEGDGEQFDDLLAGRFSEEYQGERRDIVIHGARVGSDASPALAASSAVQQLSSMLAARAYTAGHPGSALAGPGPGTATKN